MPTQTKVVDKFQLIDILSTILKAIEDDAIGTGKVTFNLTKTGMFSVSVFYMEKTGK